MEMLLDYFNKVHPMSEELQEYLIEHVNVRTLSRKDKLLKAGHICRHIYFIEAGMLRCYYMKGNTEVNSWFMKERDFAVSIESFYQQKESFESIQALEDCTVYYLSFDELQVIYKTFPEFNYIVREVTQRYCQLWAQQLYGLRMQNSQERYDWLMRYYPDLLLRVTAKHVASFLGLTEVTMSKLRSRG